MRVIITIDTEVWCNSWQTLDEDFPLAFRRYVYGSSRAGDYALPRTLEILRRHRLHAVFFVEPLFAARFGRAYLRDIVALIRDAGQEVQLHLHPEWTDEIQPPPLDDIPGKRQHLCHYSREEQRRLIALGKTLLSEAQGEAPTVFRAGSFAANRDTYGALADNGILRDSSVDGTRAYSVADMREFWDVHAPGRIGAVEVYPLSSFRDGLGRLRHAQIGACSTQELVQAMNDAKRLAWPYFAVLSHNFELLKPGSLQPDRVAVHRFEQFCAYLARHRHAFPTGGFEAIDTGAMEAARSLPAVGALATGRRYAEQALRRVTAYGSAA
jgi:peptidoglycan/xylan/chitin deacetylase (PgdA/CDA1 family)